MGYTVDLNCDCNLVVYTLEYTIPNLKPGRYIIQMQSKCYFGVSEMSNEISVWNDDEVSGFSTIVYRSY